MHIHILGVGGTFMAGIAVIAQQLGHKVTGSDKAIYPPMSTQLTEQNIVYFEGYEPEQLKPAPDCVIIGNALSRGNPAVEYVLEHNIPYISAAQWLSENVLRQCWCLAVAGTHGKTTTSSILAWILEYAHLNPSFLIGGIPENFEVSARLTDSVFFVIEADEYDTAFFDKRSKFVHYPARTAILNNLEFDHADIFPDLAAIQRQFQHFLRIIPQSGLIVHPPIEAIQQVLDKEPWSQRETFASQNSDWQIGEHNVDYSEFEVYFQQQLQGHVQWDVVGLHNAHNALAAIASARHAGVPSAIGCEALTRFRNVKRRLELRGTVNQINVYDDFAHHPTAIAATVAALRQKVGSQPITAVLEMRSNTMKMGIHQEQLADSLKMADSVYFYQPEDFAWSLQSVADELPKAHICNDTQQIIEQLVQHQQPNENILIMSNGGFEHIHQRLLAALS
ncbi:UDP-N-acetylmuramate:L-alanyl-gamma-D-glutamyl-meso-diaminopimelate ligase [Candidatus Albibeggiatoa sp. nov. BB20]|uniref:UDP-N-acetylmuramate:L-alanyl-gamma-D-glutamyl- meso-diaminopimelate ligase n=1 Tax=Candidatus Albibeggiatoa sp. nov. BB20 TaxID=3162723 RepID=UPI0033658260